MTKIDYRMIPCINIEDIPEDIFNEIMDHGYGDVYSIIGFSGIEYLL